MPSIKSVLPLLVAVALAGPAGAQDGAAGLPVMEENGHLVLSTLGHRIDLPLPDWIDPASADWSQLVSPRFADLGDQAKLEIYPRGEGEAFWTSLYGARVTLLPDAGLADFRAAVMDAYATTCRPEATAFFQLEADQDDFVPPLGFVCGAYADPALSGEGEVTIIGFYKSEAGVAMLYRGWRGDAFDPTQPGAWPVTAQAVQREIDRLKTEVSVTLAD